MRTRFFRVEHLKKLNWQDYTAWSKDFITPERLKQLESEYAFTLLHDGKPLACMGANEIWPERCEVWAIFDIEAGSNFVGLHRAAKWLLGTLPHKRIEATVEVCFDPARRFVRALGFELETAYMPFYFPNGKAGARYVRLRNG